jgi:hypothetical protein
VREGGELRSGASSGSLQLEDLSRWVLNLKTLNSTEASGFGLDTQGYHYVQAAVTKTNYAPPLTEPLVFRREAGGALSHCRARSKAELDDQHALTVLLNARDWLSGSDWEAAAKGDLAVNRTRKARGRLLKAGKVEQIEVRKGRSYRELFAPAQDLRATNWPAPPKTLAEYKGRKR